MSVLPLFWSSSGFFDKVSGNTAHAVTLEVDSVDAIFLKCEIFVDVLFIVEHNSLLLSRWHYDLFCLHP